MSAYGKATKNKYMRLSSSSLIHFTKSKDSLKGILTDNFYVKYCLEKVKTPKGNIGNAIPMVSFCDIPLSSIKEHIEKYGSYGIGLKKTWGQKMGLNPVLYVDKNSSFANNAHSALISLVRGKDISSLTETESNLSDIIRYMKNYEADLKTEKLDIKNYRFADEKEWRYVPNKEDAQMAFNESLYKGAFKKGINEEISHLRLEFKPDDINYIIINDDSEINDFINILRSSKGNGYSYNDVEKLMTRIITKEQIFNDF